MRSSQTFLRTIGMTVYCVEGVRLAMEEEFKHGLMYCVATKDKQRQADER